MVSASRFVRSTSVLDVQDASDVAPILDALKRQGLKRAALIVAGDDLLLDLLAEHRHALPDGLAPAFPEKEVVSLVRDKHRTYEAAENIGLPVPATRVVHRLADLNAAIAGGDLPPFPLLLKPEHSERFYQVHRRKGIECADENDVRRNCELLGDSFGPILIQEMIPGPLRNLICVKCVLNERSEALAATMDRKIRASAGFGACTLTVSTWDERILRGALSLLSAIGYSGYASVEFKIDERDGIPKLIEVNGRFSLNHTYALKCGVNFALLAYREALEGPLCPPQVLANACPNEVFWCSPLSLVADMILRGSRSCEPIPFLRLIRPGRSAFEPWALNDPLPTVSHLVNAMKGACGRANRRTPR